MLSTIISARVDIEALLTVILCVLAFWKGGGPEKAIASTLAGMWLVDQAVHVVLQLQGATVAIPVGHLVIDIAATVAFVWTALVANRVYPLWIAGLQLISTLAHLVRMLQPSISQSAVAILMVSPSYFEILVFAIGTWCHLRRLKQMGPYRSWSGS